MKNIVALGALQAATEVFTEATIKGVMHRAIHAVAEVAKINEQAFEAGAAAFRERSQADLLSGVSHN